MNKPSSLLLVCFLLAQLTACQSTQMSVTTQTDPNNTDAWVAIHEAPDLQLTIYIQPASIQIHPQNTQWRTVELQLNNPTATPPSSKASYILDCSKHTYQLERVTFYSEEHLQGELLETIVATEDLSFSPMSSESYMEQAVFPMACEKA